MRMPLAPVLLIAGLLISCGGAPEVASDGFVGSASCRSCHEQFYELWAPSHHGLAMQPYTPEFARAELTPQQEGVVAGDHSYRIETEAGRMIERGPGGERRYRIEQVMGGKNVYYFLTTYERGRLQTLPVAYDVASGTYFDTAASAVRHFPDIDDAPLHWTDRAYTFNTSCYGCHVSQLTINYDLAADSYRTTWSEPGINCETCHGPAAEHVRHCKESEEACEEDPRIIQTGTFSAAQVDGLCAPCHAKMIPITGDFRPGDDYFDHYDLVTLEHRDFYPDGRDLGENYTFTTWRMSPCARSGELDCMHCHTSSGRYRFEGSETNNACLPCHAGKVNNATAHTRHPAGSTGNQCVACHMPVTLFARMKRSDHSMRPPAPAATIEFESPNACNICHTDQSAEWADEIVRGWRERDYQKPILASARLVAAARAEDWSRLDEMLAVVTRPDRDEVVANSLVRLLRGCDDPRVLPAMLTVAEDRSPLIRSSAAETLSGWPSPEAQAALVKATRDPVRLVRIRAAAALARSPARALNVEDRAAVEAATAEFLASMRTRPDQDAAHANLGNFHMHSGDLKAAVESFETAVRLNPANVPALVNLALAFNLDGRNKDAEARLRQALSVDPDNAAANFNLGLLLGELGRPDEAKRVLVRALEADPHMAAAAYNLCVLESETDLDRAINYCRQATDERPDEPKYGYTLGFYLAQSGRAVDAAAVLEEVTRRHPRYPDSYALLVRVYQSLGDTDAAASVAARAGQAK